MLVDTGMPGNKEKFDEVLKSLKIDPKSIKIIVLTHGHMDHMGLVAYVKEISGAKLLVHKSIKENLNGSNYKKIVIKRGIFTLRPRLI